MKVLNEFDQHNHEFLRAILQLNTPVAELSNRLSRPGHQLYEVYLLPQYENSITQRFLEGASFNTPGQLLAVYQFEETEMKMHVVGVQARLVSEFGIGLSLPDARFHVSLQKTNDGLVISVVFGSRLAMNIMYQQGFRSRQSQEVSDECSD